MSTPEEGIFVPRRLVFIMILVSLCVNVFFLLMGILIGKDDLKWGQQKDQASPQVEGSERTLKLEDELSLFDESKRAERRPPLSKKYLSEGKQKPQAASSRPDKTPNTELPKLEPRKQAKSVRPPESGNPREAATSALPGYWIQVMAISDQGRARSFYDKARTEGFKAILISEGAFHKVRIGPFSDRTQADREKDRINKTLKVTGWLVKQ